MRLSTLSFLAGILICQTVSELPDLRWFFLIVPLVLLVRTLPFLRILLFLALGFFWTAWRADIILTQELSPILEQQEIILIGRVVDLPHYQGKRWQFDFIPSQLIFNGQSQLVPGKVRLTWENNQYPLRPGQQWQFTARLKRPHSTLNPASGDYSAKLFQQRIRATGNVRKKGQNRLLAEISGFNIDLFRYHLAQTLRQKFREHPSMGILMALTIGDQSEISPTQWDIFRRTGTTHLVVISGLHIGVVASFIYILASWLWRRLEVTTLWLPAPYFAVLMSVSFAFFYTLLAGASIPTQRAFIMVAVGIFSTLSGRIALSHKLLLALLLVVIYDPFAVMTTGFWLSFGTIAIIIYVLSGYSANSPQSLLSKDDTLLVSIKLWLQFRLRTLKRAIKAFFKIQIAISFCFAPVLLMIYADIFPASFIANPIAIPTVSLIVIPIIFLGIFAILLSQEWGYLLLSKAILIFDSTFNFLAHYVLSDTTRHTWQPFVPSLWATLIAVIGITLLLLPRGFPGRWLGVIGLLPLFFSPTTQPLQSKEVEFTLLDVGQGLASIIQTQHHILVYDTGPKHDRFDTSQAIVLPFLRSQRVQQIDTLIISHLENDHYGGSATLLKNFVVKEILTNFPQKAKNLGIIPTQPCQLGQQWQWDGVQFEILHPPSNYNTANANDSSCVLKVSIGQYALLLPGDVGKLVEYRLVQQHQQHLQADILVAPHHGSRHSSSEIFIETVKPKLVLFSAGYRNSFNHPHPQTQKRYRSRGIQLLRTDFTGAVTLRFSSGGLTKITLAREQKRRYWHDRIEFDNKSLLHNAHHK